MRPRATLTLLVLAALSPAHALAGQANTTPANVSDLVVTATRVPSPSGSVTAETTVLDGDALRSEGIAFVLDALRSVPGLMVVQGGSYGAVTSLFLRGGESDYVKVLLDGVPLNLPGGSVDLADLSTADLDRIEIVRGPASVLYGADAMSGVIQLFTRSGQGHADGDLSYRAGTWRDRDLEAHLAGSTAHLGVSAGYTRFTSNGTYDFNSDYRNAVRSLHLTWQGQGSTRAAFTVRSGDALAHYPTDYTGTPIDHNQFVSQTSLVLGGEFRTRPGVRTELVLSGYGSRADNGSNNRPDTPGDTLGFGYQDDATAITWRKGGELRFDWHPAALTVLSLGAGMEQESLDDATRTVSNVGTGPTVDSGLVVVDRTTRDLYAQLLANPAHRLSLQLGGRIDDNTAFRRHVTGRIGMMWQAGARTRIRAAAGTAFKAPTFFELFAHSAFETGNPDLAPERSSSIELGVEQKVVRDRGVVALTAFSQHFRDLIQYVEAPPGEPTYVNLGAARSRGVEATFSLRPTDGVMLGAHWTWLSTAVTDSGAASTPTFLQGGALLRRPGSSGGISASFQGGPSSLTIVVNRVGAREDVDFRDFPAARTTLPSYTTVDMALDAPIRGRGPGVAGVELTFRAENLFGARYWQTVGYPGRGRTLLAGLRLGL